MRTYTIGLQSLSIHDLEDVIRHDLSLKLSTEAEEKIKNCRNFLINKLEQSDELFYGINTGFGYLCNVRVPVDDIQTLQRNLVRSHACGLGQTISKELTRIVLFLKIQNLSLGYSGVSLELIWKLIEFYNKNTLPVLYEYGSLGASGDLAPLAHLSLPLMGEGQLWSEDKISEASSVLESQNILPVVLKEKEGLALINGTQFSTAFACRNLIHGLRLWKLANLVAVFSLEAYHSDLSPFLPELHQIRPHPGQIKTAETILKYLDQNIDVPSQSVQDPYSFRCIPQVHGASFDCIHYVSGILEIEINSVTDNPNIFASGQRVISGGNFHAQPIAFASDFLSIALAEIGSISERRSFNLLCGHRGLPEFLSPTPGLNSGMMIAQYTAASLTSKNKELASPSSTDTVTSSKGQEDHVSMAANAGTKCFQIVDNVYRILAIEFMLSNQALEFNAPKRMRPALMELREAYRQQVPALEDDRVLFTDIEDTIDFLKHNTKDFLHA